MKSFDNVMTGVIVAFDAETGDVVSVHETFTEVVDGAKPALTLPDAAACERIRGEAAEANPRRRIDAVAVAPDAVPEDGSRFHVDPFTRTPRAVPDALTFVD